MSATNSNLPKVDAAEILEECEITGGMSDGTFIAALGVPTLDGVDAHTHPEPFYTSSLEPRAELMIGLPETLE